LKQKQNRMSLHKKFTQNVLN